MNEQKAHDLLHGVLPAGATITLSRVQWTRSTVGSTGSAEGAAGLQAKDGDWHLTVTIPGPVDQVEVAFAATLAEVVDRMLRSLGKEVGGKPPKLASPSTSARSRRRNVS